MSKRYSNLLISLMQTWYQNDANVEFAIYGNAEIYILQNTSKLVNEWQEFKYEMLSLKTKWAEFKKQLVSNQMKIKIP